MSELYDDDLDDELDLDPETIDDIEVETSPRFIGRRILGGDAISTMPPLSGAVLQEHLEGFGTDSPQARALLENIIRLHQTLGDADPVVADLCAEIESGLRLHFAELHKDPAAVVLGVLARMDPATQWDTIERSAGLLYQRKARLFGNAYTAFVNVCLGRMA